MAYELTNDQVRLVCDLLWDESDSLSDLFDGGSEEERQKALDLVASTLAALGDDR